MARGSEEDAPVSSEELALERWEDDGGLVGPHPQPKTSPASGGPLGPEKKKTPRIRTVESRS